MQITRKGGKIDALKKATQELNNAQGKIGWFESAKYEDGTPVAGVAMVHEFGSPARGIPPRPFMRPTATEKRQEWAKIAQKIAKAAANGEIQPNAMMHALLLAAEGNIKQTITKLTSPPLKQTTVNSRKRELANGGAGAKGSISKPLVHTGLLLNSISSEVIEK